MKKWQHSCGICLQTQPSCPETRLPIAEATLPQASYECIAPVECADALVVLEKHFAIGAVPVDLAMREQQPALAVPARAVQIHWY